MDLSHHSDSELVTEARRLIGAERELTARLVAYLAEIEERRLHLEAGYGSMFAFCVNGLGLSENEAFRRIAAARLGRSFPIVHSLLASAAVHRPKRHQAPSSEAWRKVHVALIGLGFSPAQARQAIVEVQELHGTEFPSLEQALRETILVATRSGEQPRRVA
jgi:hypothetical protein